MLLSRVSAFFIGAVAFVIPVLAAPSPAPVVELEKRAGVTEIMSILTQLQENVGPILPVISKDRFIP